MPGGGERERLVDEASLRISDADRDLIASVLSQHAAEGRLTIEELDERLGVVYAALTRLEVRGVMAGLPALAPPEVHHRRHLGHERGEAAVVLPEWLRADETTRGRPPSRGGTPAVSPPDDDGVIRPGPTDEVMQAAYDAWRAAVTQAKAARKASQRAKAAGDKQAAFRELTESVRLTAAEKSRRAKFNDLHKLRPDWTSTPSQQ